MQESMDYTSDSDDDTVTTHLDDKTQYFLRIIMSRRMLLLNTVSRIFHKIFEGDQTSVTEKINEINTCIAPEKFNIRKAICEFSSKEYYVFVTSSCGSMEKIWPSVFSEQEMLFFKGILHLILDSEDGTVSSISCLNIELRMTKSKAESTLKRFIERKWLTEPFPGTVVLSVLSICELEPFLLDNFKDHLQYCLYCNSLSFYGVRCNGCHRISHRHCLSKYVMIKKDNLKCPSCEEPWVIPHDLILDSEHFIM